MTAIRSADRQFTPVSRAALQDNRLSLTARGVLVYLLSMPDRSLTERDLIAHCEPDEVEDVLAALLSLEEFGYLRDGVISDDPQPEERRLPECCQTLLAGGTLNP